MWAPCSCLVTRNQGLKELPLQQLEGVEQLGDGELPRLGQSTGLNQFLEQDYLAMTG